MFAVCRVLTGAGLGACIPMANTINSEYAPTKVRGLFVALGMAFMILGQILAGVLLMNGNNSLRTPRVAIDHDSGAIHGAVVHEDKLPIPEVLTEDGGDAVAKPSLRVVGGNHDAKSHACSPNGRGSQGRHSPLPPTILTKTWHPDVRLDAGEDRRG